MPAELNLRDVYEARARIKDLVERTPLVCAETLSRLTGADVRLKLEIVQETGAFKLRGATNKILSLDDAQKERGVVTVSTGNHGRAVAFAARRLGVRAVVCLSELVPANKVEAIRALGAELRITGRSQDEAGLEADRLVEEQGLALIHPFDDPLIVAGQGTIGLELMEDMPELDTVLVPLSGGGLIGGIAMALKAVNPCLRVVGITMENGAAMHESLRAGRPVEVEEVATLADSLGGGIGLSNRWTMELCRRHLDETVLVSEDEIIAGMRHLFFEERLVVEGGAAVGVSALLAKKLDVEGSKTAVVLSGRNIDMKRYLGIVQGEG